MKIEERRMGKEHPEWFFNKPLVVMGYVDDNIRQLNTNWIAIHLV